MIGYIYHIKNIETQKEYIGQTTDIDWRIYRHFRELEKGTHHSTKLQRSYNLHGKDKFKVTYEKKQFQNYNELLLAEQKEISKYDSYSNGYNETQGGEGHSMVFDFDTMVLLYQIGQRYDGIKHKLAEYYHCDRTSITAVFRKEYLKQITYDEVALKNLIKELKLSDQNLKENYKNNYSRKLTKEQVFNILATMEIKKYSGSACAKVYHVNKDVVNGIMRGKTYKEDYEEYLKLSEDKKKKIANDFCENTDIIRLHYQGQRGPVKNPLTQEQVNYILDNQKNKKQSEIAKQLNISRDRVSKVIHKESYLDMIWVYQKMHS